MNIIQTTQEIYLENGNRIYRKVSIRGQVIWTHASGYKIDELTANTIEAIYQNKCRADAEIDYADLKEIKVLEPITSDTTKFHVMCKDGTGFMVDNFKFEDNKLKLYWELKNPA